MAKEKEIELNGFFEQLTYLLLCDDSTRWKGLLIIIAVGAVTGGVDLLSGGSSPDNAMVGMSISMLITAICLFAFYSFTHTKASIDKATGLRIPLGMAGAICGFAVAFSFLSYNYQTRSLTKDFSNAIQANDYARVASVIEQTSTVSEHLHAALLQRFAQVLVRNAAELPQKTGSAKPVESNKNAQWKEHLDLPTVVAAGKEFAKASTSDPKAWEAMTVLLDYKTFLERTKSPAAGAKPNRSGTARYQFPSTIGSLWTINASDQPDVPQMRLIDQPDLNKDSRTGPAFLNVRGGEFPLDGYYLKRVIIQDAHITYNGGPLVLDQVYFVNCTFEIKQGASGLEFADAVFSQNPTMFTAAVG